MLMKINLKHYWEPIANNSLKMHKNQSNWFKIVKFNWYWPMSWARYNCQFLITVTAILLLLYRNETFQRVHTAIYMAIERTCSVLAQSILIVRARARACLFDWICNNNLWIILRSIEIFYGPNNKKKTTTNHFDWKSIKGKLHSLSLVCCVILFSFLSLCCCKSNRIDWNYRLREGERAARCVHPFVTHL